MTFKHDFSLDDALQFCSKAKASEQKQSAPRAAIYTGKLGKNSKRAMKIQSENSSLEKFKKASKLTSKQNGKSTLEQITSLNSLLKILIIACITIALVCFFCYQPAKICYTQFRNTEKVAAELALVEARNEKLESNVSSLKTDEGIEDKAKNDYGYVKQGEGAAHVSGIESEDETKLIEYVDSNKVTAPNTAITKVLDSIFDYDNSPK